MRTVACLVSLIGVLSSVVAASASTETTSSAASPAETVRPSATAYATAVTHICAGGLLFDNPHQMGTRPDALSIADDIRASTAQRLDRVTALAVPPELQNLSNRWINSQRRLAALYATGWVRIYDIIDAAHTPAQRAALPKRLERLVHAPDTLKRTAGLLELDLNVPDCTGGGT